MDTDIKESILEEKPSIQKLYYNYKKTSDDEIKTHLKTIKIVKKTHKGLNSVFGYYSLNDDAIEKISEKPRGLSLTFDTFQEESLNDEPLENVESYKTIHYLVKSSSRFFLKPDIGEIFDQIYFTEFYDKEFVAICFNEGYDLLPDTEGEHFIMTATLLKRK